MLGIEENDAEAMEGINIAVSLIFFNSIQCNSAASFGLEHLMVENEFEERLLHFSNPRLIDNMCPLCLSFTVSTYSKDITFI